MEQFSFIVVAAAVVISIFILGMSLTLIFRGHHIRSEIGDNPEMKKRGIKCTAQQMREEEAGSNSASCDAASGCSAVGCESCSEKI